TGTSDEPCRYTGYLFAIPYQSLVPSLAAPSIRFWDVASGKEQSAQTVHPWVQLNDLALSADGRLLATGCTGGTFGLRDPGPRREQYPGFVRPEDAGYWQSCEMTAKRVGFGVPVYKTSVTHVALSSDGRVLATACTAGLVQLWDAGNGQELRKL